MSALLKAVPSLCRADAAGAKCLVVRNSQADARLARALEEIEVCQPKLGEAEERMNELLHANVPKVRFRLPRLEPARFQEVLDEVRNFRGEDLYLQMRQARTSSLLEQPERPGSGERSGSVLELEDGTLPGHAAQSTEGSSCGAQGLEGLGMETDPSRNAMIRHTGAAALMALVMTGLLAISPIDTNVASLMAAIFSLLLHFVALAYAWTHQLSWIFLALNGAVGRLTSSLDAPVDCYGSKLVEPIETLESAVDMVEMEQAMMVKRMQEYENEVKQSVPDFVVPSTSSLREPIVECAGRISNFLEEAKAALPEHVEDQMQRHRYGSLVTRRSAFNCWLVQVPLIFVLVLNLVGLICSEVAAVDLAAALSSPSEAPAPPSSLDDNPLDWDLGRRLRDRSEEGMLLKDLKARFPDVSFSMQEDHDGHASQVPVLPLGSRVLVVVLPWLVQLALAWLELLAGLYFTRAPRLLAVVSSVTADVEKGCNAWLEKQGKGIPAEVFATFGKVQKESDSFFPAFRLRVGQLHSYLLASSKEKPNGLFGRAGGLFPAAGA
ncbi:unnamed protein product [Symbiodinium natans]|uniref:Uncharacterized protein n=1 Tax=Symbiodinium natans TaxID=878477 RepID=A0A812QP59_9DINO|nr:unnamed protein product [Symbiodinium natans]